MSMPIKKKRDIVPVFPTENSQPHPQPSVAIMNLPRLLTIQEAAHVLHISVRTVHRLIRKRKLDYFKLDGVLRFRSEDMERFLAKRYLRAA